MSKQMRAALDARRRWVCLWNARQAMLRRDFDYALRVLDEALGTEREVCPQEGCDGGDR